MKVSNEKKKIIGLVSVGLGVSYISFPNIYYHISILAWGCLIPILIVIGNYTEYRKRLWLCWLFFQLFFLCLFWMNPFEYYERYETLWMIIILIVFYSIFPIIFALIVSLFNPKKPWQSLVIVPSIWGVMEFVQTIFPVGFPLSLAISQYDNPMLIQLARWTGIYGISVLLLVNNIGISLWILVKKKRYLYLSISLIILNLLIGIYYIVQKPDTKNVKPYTFFLIQPNIKWREAYYSFENNYLYKHILSSLTRIAKIATAILKEGVVVFPELTISDFKSTNQELQQTIKAITDQRYHMVIGARHEGKNAVFSFSPQANMLSKYKKNKLVPMFENNETKDTKFNDPLSLYSNKIQLGTFICYESLFPSIVRTQTRKGANLLGGVSFNTWLGNTNWAMLHMAYLPFRSVENNRYAFFLNNNGPSIMCDEKGRVIEKIALGKKGFMIVECPLINDKTVYTRLGDIFVIGLVGLIILSTIIALKQGNRKRIMIKNKLIQ